MAFLARSICSLARTAVKSSRGVHTTAVVSSDPIKKWMFNSAGYQKYGLMFDDLLNDFDPDVVEAIRRLPQKLVDERNYRAVRAAQLNIEKSILPKEQWTKYEEDIPYLQPYLEEVKAERKEKEEWEATH